MRRRPHRRSSASGALYTARVAPPCPRLLRHGQVNRIVAKCAATVTAVSFEGLVEISSGKVYATVGAILARINPEWEDSGDSFEGNGLESIRVGGHGAQRGASAALAVTGDIRGLSCKGWRTTVV